MRAGLTHRRAIIVGAGQSGLAVAAALAAEGLRPQHEFVVIDAASRKPIKSIKVGRFPWGAALRP